MRKLVLDQATVAKLLFPDKDISLAEGLFRKRHDNVMLRLVRAVRDVSHASALVAEAQFLSAFDSLCSFSSPTQLRVLSYPSFSFWLDVTEELLRREVHIRFPEMHVLLHLQDFWRFAAAGAIHDQRENYSCKLRSNAAGVIPLPGTGLVISGEGLGAYETVDCILHRGDVLSLMAHESKQAIRPRLAHLPLVAAGVVEFNSIDEDLRLPGRTTYSFELLQPEDFPRWLSALEDAWSLLSATSVPMTAELPLGVRSLVPVLDGGVDTHSSASFSEAPGLIALSWHADPVILAEALVHEYHHQKLNSLQIIDPLILGPDGALFYSPWRPDPRPLGGILHGAYVFQAVLQWWDKLIPSSGLTLTAERIASRKYMLCCQIQSALATLRLQAHLTPIGKWLCEAMAKATEEYAALVQESGIVDQAGLDQRLEQHELTWRRNHCNARRSDFGLSQGAESLMNEMNADLGLLSLVDFEVRARDGNLPIAAIEENEVLLERVAACICEKDKVQHLREALGSYYEGESALRSTIRGHLAYSIREFHDAVHYYGMALTKLPYSAKLWQSFAFALRHAGRWRESTLLLANAGLLATSAESFAVGSHTNPQEMLDIAISVIGDHEIHQRQ